MTRTGKSGTLYFTSDHEQVEITGDPIEQLPDVFEMQWFAEATGIVSHLDTEAIKKLKIRQWMNEYGIVGALFHREHVRFRVLSRTKP